MSLVACPDCGHETSTRAQCCPQCGCPAKTEKPNPRPPARRTPRSQRNATAGGESRPARGWLPAALILLAVAAVTPQGMELLSRLASGSRPHEGGNAPPPTAVNQDGSVRLYTQEEYEASKNHGAKDRAWIAAAEGRSNFSFFRSPQNVRSLIASLHGNAFYEDRAEVEVKVEATSLLVRMGGEWRDPENDPGFQNVCETVVEFRIHRTGISEARILSDGAWEWDRPTGARAAESKPSWWNPAKEATLKRYLKEHLWPTFRAKIGER